VHLGSPRFAFSFKIFASNFTNMFEIDLHIMAHEENAKIQFSQKWPDYFYQSDLHPVN
jgi:hypothetical protein